MNEETENKEKKTIVCEPLSANKEILEEIKKILVSEINKDKNCISVYEVTKLLKLKHQEYKNLLEKANDDLQKN